VTRLEAQYVPRPARPAGVDDLEQAVNVDR